MHIDSLRGLDEGHVVIDGTAGETEEACSAWGGAEETHDLCVVTFGVWLMCGWDDWEG